MQPLLRLSRRKSLRSMTMIRFCSAKANIQECFRTGVRTMNVSTFFIFSRRVPLRFLARPMGVIPGTCSFRSYRWATSIVIPATISEGLAIMIRVFRRAALCFQPLRSPRRRRGALCLAGHGWHPASRKIRVSMKRKKVNPFTNAQISLDLSTTAV